MCTVDMSPGMATPIKNCDGLSEERKGEDGEDMDRKGKEDMGLG